MRGDRHRRDRTAVVMLRQQPHREIVGIVVVADVGLLDLHLLQPGFVEQMARKLGTGARQIRAVGAMPLEFVPHPKLRAEYDGEEDQPADGE